MDNEHPTEAPPDAVPGTSREAEPGSPFVRFGLFIIFVLTLPFTWGENSSCNGPHKTYTGLEQLTNNPGNAIAIGVIFGTPVLLGFVQYYLRPPWMRAIAELISAMFSALGTFYCFLATILQGDLTHKSSRFYPAPLIATIAALMMTLHAFRGAFARITEMFVMRRKEKPRG